MTQEEFEGYMKKLIMPFGKYKGKSVYDVYKENLQYLVWFCKETNQTIISDTMKPHFYNAYNIAKQKQEYYDWLCYEALGSIGDTEF